MWWKIALAVQLVTILSLWRSCRELDRNFWIATNHANDFIVLADAFRAKAAEWKDIAARQRDAAFMAAKERDIALTSLAAALSNPYSQN